MNQTFGKLSVPFICHRSSVVVGQNRITWKCKNYLDLPLMQCMHLRQHGAKSQVPLIDLGGFQIAVYTTKGVTVLGAKIYSAPPVSATREEGSLSDLT